MNRPILYTILILLLVAAVILSFNRGTLKPQSPPLPKLTAAQIVEDAVKAHAALNAVSASLSLTNQASGAQMSQTLSFEYMRPVSAKVTLEDETGSSRLWCAAGTKIYLVNPVDKQYTTATAMSPQVAIFATLSQCNSNVADFYSDPSKLLDAMNSPGTTATLGPADNIAGVPANQVILDVHDTSGGSRRVTFAFGALDKLLRRVTILDPIPSAGSAPAVTLTETVTALDTSPKFHQDEFTFVPHGFQFLPPDTEADHYDKRIVPGAKPFPFHANDLDGQPVSLDAYRGKVLLLDFWATWCGPCVGEMPNVISAYKKYHGQGFDILGISMDQTAANVKSFIAQNDMEWPQICDEEGMQGPIPVRYNLSGIPLEVLVGRNGKIADVDVRGPDLETDIQKALRED